MFTPEQSAAIIAARKLKVPIAVLAAQYGTSTDGLNSWLYRQRRAGAAIPKSRAQKKTSTAGTQGA